MAARAPARRIVARRKLACCASLPSPLRCSSLEDRRSPRGRGGDRQAADEPTRPSNTKSCASPARSPCRWPSPCSQTSSANTSRAWSKRGLPDEQVKQRTGRAVRRSRAREPARARFQPDRVPRAAGRRPGADRPDRHTLAGLAPARPGAGTAPGERAARSGATRPAWTPTCRASTRRRGRTDAGAGPRGARAPRCRAGRARARASARSAREAQARGA